MLCQLKKALKKAAKRTAPLMVVGSVFVATMAVSAPCASAAGGWTVLGGDPLFAGGIPNASQEGRNKFVHDMLSPKGVTAQKRAGLGAKERQAFKQALVHGEFKKCTLHVGDHFEAMSYGVGAVLVDHNVTFEDTRYSGSGAPAFCLSVEVGKSGSIVNIKVPFKCENFSVVNRVHGSPPKSPPHHKSRKPKKPKKKHKKEIVCKSGTVKIGNNCSPQTNNGELECLQKGNGWRWEGGNVMNCVQIQVNGVCSAQNGAVNGNNNTINQEVKCCVATNSCNEVTNNPPPEEKPPAEKVTICTAGQVKNAQGVCVTQENKAEQTCQVNLQGNWNTVTQKCEITQINGNCSTIVVLKEVYVEGPLTINIENETCVVKEEKHEPPPKESEPWAELMEPQEVDVTKSSELCAVVYGGTNVVFHANTGHFAGKVHAEPQYGPEGLCDTYTAGSDAGIDTFWVTFKDKQGNTHKSEVKDITVQNPEEEHGGWH
jgi:hypothetical protein